jgi:hypothetical protein
MVSGAKPDDLLILSKLVNSIGLFCTPDDAYGTVFLAKVPDVGICMLTAGHNFDALLNEKPTPQTMKLLSKYTVWFANLDGIFPDDETTNSELEKGKPMNLKKLLERFDFYGSICCKQKRKVFKKTSTGMETSFDKVQGEGDYAAFVLNYSNVDQELADLGLNFLDCATESELRHEPNHVAAIIGHPGHYSWKTYPTRLSYGKEVDETKDTIKLDYDSLGGNSGSPVFGKGYRVKGIHVAGSGSSNNNIAQKINNVEQWINIAR